MLEVGRQYGMVNGPAFFPVALLAALRGELERAADLAKQGRELGDKEGALLSGLVAPAGVTEVWSGDAAAAIESFAAAEKKADAAEWFEPNLRWWRADYLEALLELGRTADAVVVLDAWEADAWRVNRAWVLAQVTRCRALVAAARGDVEQGIRLCSSAAATRTFHSASRTIVSVDVRRRLKAGTPHRFVISDGSSTHDFHLSGPGINRVLTGVRFTGTKSFVLKLRLPLRL